MYKLNSDAWISFFVFACNIRNKSNYEDMSTLEDRFISGTQKLKPNISFFPRIHWEMKLFIEHNGKGNFDIGYYRTITPIFYGFPKRVFSSWIQHKWKCKHITSIIGLDLYHFGIASSTNFSIENEKRFFFGFLHLNFTASILFYAIYFFVIFVLEKDSDAFIHSILQYRDIIP